MGNNRIQHYNNCVDRSRKRLALDKAKRKMEEDLYRQIDEDYGKKLICKMAQERDEDSKDVNTGSVIKDKNG